MLLQSVDLTSTIFRILALQDAGEFHPKQLKSDITREAPFSRDDPTKIAEVNNVESMPAATLTTIEKKAVGDVMLAMYSYYIKAGGLGATI